MLEVEVKIKTDIEEMERRLSSLGFNKGASVYEKDIYYNGDTFDLRESDEALRIRKHTDLDSGVTCFILNHKGPRIDDVSMTREETEYEVEEPSNENILEYEGRVFHAAGLVEKKRIHYSLDDIDCCLDTVTGLGEFLEIEIMSEPEKYELSLGRIKELLDKLDLSIEDSITTSYLCMLERK